LQGGQQDKEVEEYKPEMVFHIWLEQLKSVLISTASRVSILIGQKAVTKGHTTDL
jgi:hypothetical protein